MWRSGYFVILFLLVNHCLKAQGAIDHWEAIIKAENNWKFFVGTNEPPEVWINPDFNDVGWTEGSGGFGYGDEDDGTVISPASSVYMRIKFTITDLSELEKIVLLADYDDAYIAYLNGVEISRGGISGNRPAHNQFADYDHEASLYRGVYPSEIIFTKTEISSHFVSGENVLAIQVHNINATSSDLSSNFYLCAGLGVSSIIYQEVPEWFRPPLDFESSNLPIVKINTEGRNIPDEPKITATMGIIDNGPGNINHKDDPFNDYNGHIGIELRGSSSQSFPKKQFAVELRTALDQDTSATVLGLPEEEDWVLYAPYSDKSLIRNVLAYKFAADLGWYAPRTRLCELYLNEQYQGVYILTEKIKRDKNRVDISKLNPDETSGDDLTGGYIVKLDKYDGATVGLGWDSPYVPPNRSDNQVIHFQYHYPKEDEIHAAQQDYIENYITEFEHALLGPYFTHPSDGFRQYIDVYSFIDFAIINELSRNVDGYRLSTFLFKDKDSKNGKLHIGPVWDFNLAFGNANYCEGGNAEGWAWDFNDFCNGDFWLIPFWWRRFLRDPEYVVQLQSRWTALRQNVYSNQTIMNYIDSVAAILEEPQQRNFAQWPILSEWIWPNNYVGGLYANEINYLKNWISSRLSWLDLNIAALEVVTDLNNSGFAKGRISIYPNPNDGEFYIQFNDAPPSSLQIVVYNQVGEKISHRNLEISNLNNDSSSLFSKIDGLSSGIYFVMIADNRNRLQTKKLIVN